MLGNISVDEKICSVCNHRRCNVAFQPCGHVAHARCIYPWPVVACPSCSHRISEVECLDVEPYVFKGTPIELSNNSRVFGIARKGRWTKEEQDYVQLVIEAFNSGMLPVEEKCKLGSFLCRMLLCQPARLSSKIRTGKKVFHSRFQDAVTTPEVLHYLNLQKRLSDCEQEFLTKLGNSDDLEEASALSFHIQYCWAQNFVSSSGGRHHRLQQIMTLTKPLPELPQDSTSIFFKLFSMMQGSPGSGSEVHMQCGGSDVLSIAHEVFSHCINELGIAVKASTRTVLFTSPSFQRVLRMIPELERLNSIEDLKCIFQDPSALVDAILNQDEASGNSIYIEEPFQYNQTFAGAPLSGAVVRAYRRFIPKLVISEDADWCSCTVLVFFIHDFSICMLLPHRNAPTIDTESRQDTTDSGGKESATSGLETAHGSGGRGVANSSSKRRKMGDGGSSDLGDVDARGSGAAVAVDEATCASGASADGFGVISSNSSFIPSSSSSVSSYSSTRLSIESAIGSFFFNLSSVRDAPSQHNTSSARSGDPVPLEQHTGQPFTSAPTSARSAADLPGSMSADAALASLHNMMGPPSSGSASCSGLIASFGGISSSLGVDSDAAATRKAVARDAPLLISAITKTTRSVPATGSRFGSVLSISANSDSRDCIRSHLQPPLPLHCEPYFDRFNVTVGGSSAPQLPTSVTDAFTCKLGSFLHRIPFDVVELWIPVQISPTSTVLLFGGSAATDPALQGWSAYSRNFVFSQREGLPGRVLEYQAAESQQDVAALTLDTFLRADGALSFGIHASVGLPVGPVGGMVEGMEDDVEAGAEGVGEENYSKAKCEEGELIVAEGSHGAKSMSGVGVVDVRSSGSTGGGIPGDDMNPASMVIANKSASGAVIVLYSKKVFEPSPALVAFMAHQIRDSNIQTSVRLLKKNSIISRSDAL